MALHLLITDKAQHEFGPDSLSCRHAALSTADYCVGVLRQGRSRRRDSRDRTTFVIAADHGFVTVRDEMNLAPVLTRARRSIRTCVGALKAGYVLRRATANIRCGAS